MENNNTSVLRATNTMSIKPERLIIQSPPELQLTDKDGNVHTYSLVDIFDALVKTLKPRDNNNGGLLKKSI